MRTTTAAAAATTTTTASSENNQLRLRFKYIRDFTIKRLNFNCCYLKKKLSANI